MCFRPTLPNNGSTVHASASSELMRFSVRMDLRRIDERTIMIKPYKPRNNASPKANWNHEQNPMIPVGPTL